MLKPKYNHHLFDIDKIVQSIDIVDYISHYTDLNPRGGDFWGSCPLPNHPGAETVPSFKVDPHKQLWFCFGCDGHNGKVLGGNVIQFVREMEEVDFKEALEIIRDYITTNEIPINTTPIRQPRKPSVITPEYHFEDDGSGDVCFWMVSIFWNIDHPIKCPISDVPQILAKLVAHNPPNAGKKDEWGVVSRLRDQWAGRYVLIMPDTDYHKKFPNEYAARKDEWMEKMKALPYCVAIIGTYSGGIAPIFVADTIGVNPAEKPSEWMRNPDWIRIALDKDENTQRRFLHEILWTNPNAVPFSIERSNGEPDTVV